MSAEEVDAVVVGAGHNGLVTANRLADAGWDVLVLEGAATPGGAVRTAEVTAPGYASDLFSAFYPMAAGSPALRSLGLEDHGLRWAHAPVTLGHARGPDQPAVLLHRDPVRTAAGLETEQAGDGDAWLELSAGWARYGPAALDALLSPFPPVRSGARFAWRARRDLLEFARLAVLPVRRLAEERFGGPAPGLLLGGNALHADVAPEAPPSGLLGWLMVGMAQTFGFPAPVGGAGALVDALVARLRAAGGEVRSAAAVERIELVGGRAAVVHTAAGAVRARRAVVAAVDAEVLYRSLLAPADVPAPVQRGLRRFQRGQGTVKVDWAVEGGVPWADPALGGAGTVHVADSLDELTMTTAEITTGRLPTHPFLLVGQMTTTDPSRSPAGTEALWAYTHVPAGPLAGDELAAFVERVEDRLEANAPGFRGRVVGRHVQGPADFEAANPSLVGGDIGGGTSQLHQQLIFRPFTGWGRPETPIPGLYLGSSSAHPGAGVHGACGANAARAALLHDRLRRRR